MASAYLSAFPMPEHFQLVMGRLVKAILRDQPNDVVSYAANYFQRLEKTQKEALGETKLTIRSKAEIHFKQEYGAIQQIEKSRFLSFVRSFMAAHSFNLQIYPNNLQQINQYIEAKGDSSLLPTKVFLDALVALFML